MKYLGKKRFGLVKRIKIKVLALEERKEREKESERKEALPYYQR